MKVKSVRTATQQWKKYDKLRPDYDHVCEELKSIEKANKEEAKQLEKIRLEELKKVQEKLSKLENEKSTKEWEEVDKEIDKQNAEKKAL